MYPKMSTGSQEPFFFASIYSGGETVVSDNRKPLWESRIPTPKKENQKNWIASPRNHIPLLPVKTTFTVPKAPLGIGRKHLAELTGGNRPLAKKTGIQPQSYDENSPNPLTVHHSPPPRPRHFCPGSHPPHHLPYFLLLTFVADKTHYPRYPRPVYKESELVAARAHELVADMGLALDIIIKNSPAKRQPQPSSRSSSGVLLDDASFACEFGLEQYREGFKRRSMQSEPGPMKVVEELKRELRKELRCEIKKELRAEVEVEVMEEIKEELEELYGNIAEQSEQKGIVECETSRRTIDSTHSEVSYKQGTSTEHKAAEQSVISEKPKAIGPNSSRRVASLSIQDMVKELRDDMSEGDEDDNATTVEERTDPSKDALAAFLNWKAPPKSGSSGSVYSQE